MGHQLNLRNVKNEKFQSGKMAYISKILKCWENEQLSVIAPIKYQIPAIQPVEPMSMQPLIYKYSDLYELNASVAKSYSMRFCDYEFKKMHEKLRFVMIFSKF